MVILIEILSINSVIFTYSLQIIPCSDDQSAQFNVIIKVMIDRLITLLVMNMYGVNSL